MKGEKEGVKGLKSSVKKKGSSWRRIKLRKTRNPFIQKCILYLPPIKLNRG